MKDEVSFIGASTAVAASASFLLARRLRIATNIMAPMSARPPMIAPTLMPAFAPADKPLLEVLLSTVALSELVACGAAVLDAVVVDAGCVSVTNSEDVTLKQGTWSVNAEARTNV